MSSVSYVIVGGGISSVSCAQEIRNFDDSGTITLISASSLLKVVKNRTPVGQLMESFDISEEIASKAFTEEDNVSVVRGTITTWNWKDKLLKLDDGRQFSYDKLCICTGGRPKNRWRHPLVISIRDTETLEKLNEKMKNARRVVVIGNGGIATEVVYELKNVEIIWAIRHSSISATFFDEGAAEFFKSMLLSGRTAESVQEPMVSKRYRIIVEKDTDNKSEIAGCALGPDWASAFDISGSLKKRSVHVIYKVEMKKILEDNEKVVPVEGSPYSEGNWPLYIELSDGQIVGCDLLVQATGVKPNSEMWKAQCNKLELANDGGILVDDHMMSSIPDVYACGDVCTAGWEWSEHWMQMRLWTQAFQMGAYCGRSMAMPDIALDFCFELFTHVTTFFGYKVIFLGKFNGSGVEKPWHLLMRVTNGREYIKLIVRDGRIQGAVLIGDTNLEGTIENLILDKIDITNIEEGLLDPNIDIDDYFD